MVVIVNYKLCDILKRTRRAKLIKIWALGVVFRVHGTFDRDIFKVNLGSFSAFAICVNVVSRKRLVIDQKGVKFKLGPWNIILVSHVLYLTL